MEEKLFIGDLVSVVDNWYDMVAVDSTCGRTTVPPTQPVSLPLFDHQKRVHGLIVDRENYPGINAVKDEELNPYTANFKHSGLYHVLLSNGKVKKYFQNRLEKISAYQLGGKDA